MTNTQTIALKETALQDLKWVFKTFQEDLEALPEEAFDKQFGGKARTVSDLVHEVVLVQDHVRLTITRQDLFDWPEGWITAPEDLRTKDAVMNHFTRSADEFIEAVNGFSEDQMTDEVKSDDKMVTPYSRCRYIYWHAGYHSGQLNYVQTLLGDDGWHWK